MKLEQCSKHSSVRWNHKNFRLEGTVEWAGPASAQSRANFNLRWGCSGLHLVEFSKQRGRMVSLPPCAAFPTAQPPLWRMFSWWHCEQIFLSIQSEFSLLLFFCPSSFHLQEMPGAAFSICLSGQWQTAAGLSPSLFQAEQLLSMKVPSLESLFFWLPHGLFMWGISTLKPCLPPGALALFLLEWPGQQRTAVGSLSYLESWIFLKNRKF